MDDDFWNASSHSGFNFDDEEEDLNEATNALSDATVFRGLAEGPSVLPIHAIISKSGIDILLNDIKSTFSQTTPPIEETVKKLTSGLPCNLRLYVKFTDKMQLLDKVLITCDANAITKVILFLKSSLKMNIFHNQLAKRKTAVKHYAYYLAMRNCYEELIDLYMVTGQTTNMKHLFYLINQGVTNKATLYRKLEQFIMEHLPKLNSNEDKIEIYDNLHLIKFQMEHKFASKSVITQLCDFYKYELSQHRGLDKLREFKKDFRIDDFTFDWTVMNVLASMQLWMHINDIFIKNNWLTKKNVLKTAVPPEVFLGGLNRHNPPKDILEALLKCLSDTEKAFTLANKLQCHNYIIQYYTSQRDRLALIGYKSKVAHQSSEYYLIESALQSNEKKWKN